MLGASGVVLTAACAPTAGPGTSPSVGASPQRYATAGYIPYWDQQRAFDVVHRHPDVFDDISPMWFSPGPRGEIVLADPQHTHVNPGEVTFLRRNAITVLPTITNLREGEWRPELVSTILSDPGLRHDHVRSIARFVEEHGYDGIDIDYESLRGADRRPFSAFLTELADTLHMNGRMLTSSAYAKQSEPGDAPHTIAQDYTVLGRTCDHVRLMTYDYHYSTSEPGPVAPREWVEDVVRWASTRIPPERISLGVVLLGYDWPSGAEGRTVTYERATSLADEHAATVDRHGSGLTPSFTYTDRDGRGHEVWYEDATSTQAKLRLAETYGLGSAFFWRLGGEDPATWHLPEIAPG